MKNGLNSAALKNKAIVCFLVLAVLASMFFVGAGTYFADAAVLSVTEETVLNACDYTRADEGLTVNTGVAGINGEKFLGETNNNKTADYVINTETGGAYSVKTVYAATTSSGSVVYTVDGKDAGNGLISSTGGWEEFTGTTEKAYFMLTAGEHSFKVKFAGEGYNVNSFIFTYEGENIPEGVFTGTVLKTNESTVINACDFSNSSGGLQVVEKPELDINGSKFLSETNNNKTADYKIKADKAGIYEISVIYGAALEGGVVTFSVDGTEAGSTEPFTTADGWEVFTGVSSSVNLNLTEGEHVLQVKFGGTNYNVNSYTVSFAGTAVAAEGETSVALLDYVACSSGISEDADSFEFAGLTGKVCKGIGWAPNWTEYKIYVGTSGLYSIKLGYSTPADYPSSKLVLSENGTDLASWTGLSSTGGWANWDYSDTVQVSFTKGVHIIRLRTDAGNGGQNFIVMTFGAAASYNVSGTLVKEGASSVISGVAVELYAYDGSSVTGSVLKSTVSDSNGAFAFENLPNGSYAVKTGNVVVPVTVEDGDVTGVSLTVPEVIMTYSLSGMLVKGGPDAVIEEITVELYAYDGGSVTGSALQTAVSGSNGVFAFTDKVLNGNYAVKAGDIVQPVTVDGADIDNISVTIPEPVIKGFISSDSETYFNACDYDSIEGDLRITEKIGISGNKFLGETNNNKKAHYTLNVEADGNYILRTVFGAPPADVFGTVIYFIDNAEVGRADTYTTGHWENFEGITAPVTLSLTAGSHSFTVQFAGQNYNVNTYIFKPEGIEEEFSGSVLSPINPTEVNATAFISGDSTLVKKNVNGVKFLGETNNDKTATYGIKVEATGVYNIVTRFGGIGGGTVYFSFDGGEEVSTEVYATSGWGDLSGESSAAEIELSEGEHVMTVRFGGASGYDVMSYVFTKKEALDVPEISENGENAIILSSFDSTNDNGLSVGEEDFTDGNQSGKILSSAGWNNYGEYNVYVTDAGHYTVKFRYSTNADNATVVKLYCDNTLIATFDETFVSTGGWFNWTDSAEKQVKLAGGLSKFKIVFEGSGGINFITALLEYVPESIYDVSGTLVREGTSAPISGAALDIFAYNQAAGAISGDLLDTVLTDDQGNFTVYGLVSGSYAVKIGSLIVPFTIDGANVSGVTVTVPATELPDAEDCVDIEASGINVIQISEYDDNFGFPGSFAEQYDDEGVTGNVVGDLFSGYWAEYYINVKEAGEYIFKFRYSNITETATIRLWDDMTLLGEIAVTNATGGWFNWTDSQKVIAELSEGVHILKMSIEAGSGGMNYTAIYVEKAVYYSASGTLTKKGADSVINGVEIKLYNYDGSDLLNLIETVRSGADGSFTFGTKLLNGEYAMVINGKTSTFTISGEDKTNIAFAIDAPTYALSGALTKGDDTAEIGNVKVELYEYDGTSVTGKALQSTKSKTDGSFVFSKKIESGNYAVVVNGITVPVTIAGADKSDVSVAVVTLKYSVSGSVVDAGGMPAADIQVKLYEVAEDGALSENAVAEIKTDSEGKFAFAEKIIAGRYAVSVNGKIVNFTVTDADKNDIIVELDAESDTPSGTNTGLIIGISAGVAAVAAVAAVAIILIKKKKNNA